LLDIFAFNTQTLVESLGKEVKGGLRCNFFKHRKCNRGKLVRPEWRPVVLGRVDPSIQKVVVAVGKTFRLEEEINGGLFIEFFAYFCS
jgi:hypothetical protein